MAIADSGLSQPTQIMLVVLRLARRLQVGVLLLWACCLGVAVASPWIGDPAAPRLPWVCGEHSGDRLVASLDGAPGTTQDRGLDCPLCLPFGAPQPTHFAIAVADAVPDVPHIAAIGMARIHEQALRPPARAPPHRNPNQKVTP